MEQLHREAASERLAAEAVAAAARDAEQGRQPCERPAAGPWTKAA